VSEPNWHHANIAILDRESREGTVSVFLDYDLARWTFGVRFEHDPCWYGIVIEAGPVSLTFDYWRRWQRIVSASSSDEQMPDREAGMAVAADSSKLTKGELS
jgi:hypothetical protein